MTAPKGMTLINQERLRAASDEEAAEIAEHALMRLRRGREQKESRESVRLYKKILRDDPKRIEEMIARFKNGDELPEQDLDLVAYSLRKLSHAKPKAREPK